MINAIKYAALPVLIALTACGPATEKKDYEVTARCQELGYKPGNAEYDRCLKEEKASKMLRKQREEFEHRKQEERDWNMRRY